MRRVEFKFSIQDPCNRGSVTGDVRVAHDVLVCHRLAPRPNTIKEIPGVCRNIQTTNTRYRFRYLLFKRIGLDLNTTVITGFYPPLLTDEANRTRSQIRDELWRTIAKWCFQKIQNVTLYPFEAVLASGRGGSCLVVT